MLSFVRGICFRRRDGYTVGAALVDTFRPWCAIVALIMCSCHATMIAIMRLAWLMESVRVFLVRETSHHHRVV